MVFYLGIAVKRRKGKNMNGKMRALIKTARGEGNMEIRQVDIPRIKPDEVLVRIRYVGVCGTDIKIYDDTFYSDVPVTVGHEFSGEIVEMGENVKGLSVGGRVVSEQHWNACGVCRYCLTGKRHLCPDKRSPGYLSDGAYADYIAVNQSLIHRIPDGLSYEEACLIEPMGIAAHALFEKVHIEVGDKVVILGSGPIALMALQIVKAMGAGWVCLTGLDADEPYRFPLAMRLGADRVINVMKESAKDIVLQKTGIGADVIIDLSGAGSAIAGAFEFIRKDGRFCAIGLPHGNISLPWADMVLKAVNVYFSYSSGFETWEKCLYLISAGKVDLKPFTNAIYELSEWKKAFEDARAGKVLKAIIRI